MKKIIALLTICLLISCKEQAQVKLRIIETTDIHGFYNDFDYYQNKESKRYGLVKGSTLIKELSKGQNFVLVDNGDLLQGSPMADFIANNEKFGKHPAYKAMNHMKYDIGNLGNHDFNYGLEFLNESLKDADFPYINANVFDAKTKKPYFKQYHIQNKKVTDTKGKVHELGIGYIGFVPPQIMTWDKSHLEGRVFARDIVTVARELVSKMKNEGADIIIAIPHSGISTDKYKVLAENSAYYLSKVPYIDAIAFGHTHATFPSKMYDGIEGIDTKKGTINGVPSVMAGKWGSHVGTIDLKLNFDGNRWEVITGSSKVHSIFDKESGISEKADLELREILQDDHERTLKYVSTVIGKSKEEFYSYLSLIQDDSSMQIVSNAQIDYVKRAIQGDVNNQDIPVLSAVAPFKAGGRKNDPTGFSVVEKGQLSLRNAADLYLYANTLYALKINGQELKSWLECSAGMFERIDTKYYKPQPLLNWGGFRTYNFDVIDGVTYEIDVTKHARYDGDCKDLNPESSRIVNLKYQGKEVKDTDRFILATNSYRATSGKFPGAKEENILFAAPDTNRQILINYIRSESKKNGFVQAKPDMNWKFKKLTSSRPLQIYFESSPEEKAKRYIKQQQAYPIKDLEKKDDVGFQLYQVELK